MDCSIIRNEENKITKVLNEVGEESQLFINIAKSPLVKDTEEALNIYKNVYSENFNGDRSSSKLEDNIYTSKDGEKFYIEIYDGINGKISSLENRKETEKIGLSVINSNGEKVATMGLKKDSDGQFFANIIKVNENQQRKGIATSLYEFLANNNIPVKDSDIQTEKGKLFKQSISKKDNVSFVYQTADGSYTNSYKEALKNSDEIKAGFLQNGEFTKLLSTTKSVNRDSEVGYINSAIEQGLLSGEKIRIGDDYKFITEGETELKKNVNAELLSEDAVNYVGFGGVIRDENVFDIVKVKDKILVSEDTYITEQEFDALSDQQIQAKYSENADQLIAGKYYTQNRPAQRDTQIIQPTILKTEKEAQLGILNLLNKMGVKITSLSNYVSDYRNRNGVDPSARALADIAMRTIALKDGVDISEDELAEELGHFIVEFMPDADTADILRNIDRSEEWLQFADIYKKKYAEEYTPELLETAVRKEILGKIVGKAVLNRNIAPSNNFISKALEFIQTFVDRIANYFKPEYAQELSKYLEDVNSLLLKDSVFFANRDLSDNPFRFYSLEAGTPENKLIVAARKTASQLESAAKSLRKTRGVSPISSVDLLKLKNLDLQVQDTAEVEAIATLVGITNNISKYLEKALEDSSINNKNYALSQEEVVLFEFVSKQALPSIGELGELIKDNKGDDWDILKSRIKETQDTVLRVIATKSLVTDQTLRRLIDEVLRRGGYPESMRQYFENYMNRNDQDVSALAANVGTLINSKDPTLGLLSVLITNMHNVGHQENQNNVKRLQKAIKDEGYTEKVISEFGSKDGFILSRFDFKANTEAHNKNFITAFKQVITDSTLTDEEIIQQRDENSLNLNPVDNDNILRIERDLSIEQDLDEKPRTKEYYDAQNKKYQEAGISEDTIFWNSAYLSSVGQIMKHARTAEGILDRSSLRLPDLDALEILERGRLTAKNYYTESGELKKGLEYERDSNGRLVRDETGKVIIKASSNEISVDARIALDLNKLDSLNVFSSDVKFIEKYRQITGDTQTADKTIIQNRKDNKLALTEEQREDLFTIETLPQTYLDLITNIDNTKGREAAIKAINLNSFIGFSEAFWSSMGDAESQDILDKLETVKQANPEVQELIQSIEEDRIRVRGILKTWAKKGSPSEISEDISQTSKDSIRNVQERLEANYEKASKYIKSTFEEREVSIGISESNESFNKEVADLGLNIDPSTSEEEQLKQLDKLIDFIGQNSTTRNKNKLLNDKYQIEQFRLGKRATLPLSIERLANERELDLNNTEEYIYFMQEYGKTKLLPYYKRFAPASYSQFRQELQTTENLTELLQDTVNDPTNFININPNYSFYDAQEDGSINPNYDRTSRVGYLQPNVAKFKNKAFYDKFGQNVKVENDRIIVDSSSNQKLAKVYNAVLDYNEASLDAEGMADTGYNYFTMPQVRKNGLERTKSLVANPSISTVVAALKDTFAYTQEEQVEGERYNGINVIPQPYVQKLRDSKDLATEDLFYTLFMRGKEGFLRKAKVNAYGDINSISDSINLRQYNGKAVESTNAYKQVKAVIDYQYYGIKEEVTLPFETAFGTLSGAKIVKSGMKFISLKNLGFSPIISLTGYGTMKVAQLQERWAGQYMQNNTYKKGSKEFDKLVKDSLLEFGQVNTEAKLNVLGQFFQAFDLEVGLRNSQYGWLARAAPRTAMGLYQAVAYPIFAKNLLTTLHDYRIADGRIHNFQSFRQVHRRQGKSLKQVEEMWKEYDNNPIYNYIETKDGEVSFNREQLGQAINLEGTRLDEEILSISNDIRAQTKNLNVKIDMQLPQEEKVGIQRHFLWNLLLTHKSFIIPLTESRFKTQQFNSLTRSLEEGSYNSTYKFLGGVINEWKQNGGNILKAFKDEYNGTNKDAENWEEVDLRQANLKRVMKDVVIANTLMLLSLLVRGIADDPDKKDVYSLQFTNLILARLNSEVYQSNLGIYSNYQQIMESPVLAYDTMVQMSNMFDESKGVETLRKNTPILNSFIKLRDPAQQFENLRYQTEVRNDVFKLSPLMYIARDKE